MKKVLMPLFLTAIFGIIVGVVFTIYPLAILGALVGLFCLFARALPDPTDIAPAANLDQLSADSRTAILPMRRAREEVAQMLAQHKTDGMSALPSETLKEIDSLIDSSIKVLLARQAAIKVMGKAAPEDGAYDLHADAQEQIKKIDETLDEARKGVADVTTRLQQELSNYSDETVERLKESLSSLKALGDSVHEAHELFRG